VLICICTILVAKPETRCSVLRRSGFASGSLKALPAALRLEPNVRFPPIQVWGLFTATAQNTDAQRHATATKISERTTPARLHIVKVNGLSLAQSENNTSETNSKALMTAIAATGAKLR
jgi:hypothetical protein